MGNSGGVFFAAFVFFGFQSFACLLVSLLSLPDLDEERGISVKRLSNTAPSWWSAPWFLVENYFYKRILEHTDRFCPLATPSLCDPFATQKLAALSAAEPAFKRTLSAGLATVDDLHLLIHTSLWGNLADLSFSAGDADEGTRHYGLSSAKTASQLATDGGKLLHDDTSELVKLLRRLRDKKIVIVLDNVGLDPYPPPTPPPTPLTHIPHHSPPSH